MMPSYVCPICGRRLSAATEDSLKALIEAHMRGHDAEIVKTKTPREELIWSIKNRIAVTKMNIKRLERELREQRGILKILYKSLEMLEAKK